MLRKIVPLAIAVFVVVLLAATLAPPTGGRPGVQDEPCHTFLETGRNVCGDLLSYWRSHGGLSKLGYPLSNLFVPDEALSTEATETYLLQYFQHAVLKAPVLDGKVQAVSHEVSSEQEFRSKYPEGEPFEPLPENLPRYPGSRRVEAICNYQVVCNYRVGTEAEVQVTYAPVATFDANTAGITKPAIEMTFVSDASPEALLAFYREILPKSGWQCEWSCDKLENPSKYAVTFSYSPKNDPFHVSPAYSIEVSVTDLSASERKVMVELWLIGAGSGSVEDQGQSGRLLSADSMLYSTAAHSDASLSAAVTQATHTPELNQEKEQPQTTPVNLSLPDLEYLPIYPDPSIKIVEAYNESPTFRRFVYTTNADYEMVQTFYKSALLKYGWVEPDRDPSTSRTNNYIWSSPSGSLPWHLKLDFSMSLADTGGTNVVLIYGRYPDVHENLPIYPDASEVAVQKLDFQDSSRSEIIPTHIITREVVTVTFATNATPREIEAFYNSNMPGYGWIFFDGVERSGTQAKGRVDTQTGSIDSPEGLYFRGNRPGTSDKTVISMHLHITASTNRNERTRIQLEVLVSEVRFVN